MTVAELRKALEGLPDDMPVVGNDSGGYPDLETTGWVDEIESGRRYYPEEWFGRKIFYIA